MYDMESEEMHVFQNKRYTVGQPEEFERCIYLCGPCNIAGVYVDDEHTIPSLLQKELNYAGFSCKVENLGLAGGDKIEQYIARAMKEALHSGDIILFDAEGHGASFSGIPMLNLTDVMEENHMPVEWMVDAPRHCNHKANQLYAEAMYQELLPTLQKSPTNRFPVAKQDYSAVKRVYIDKYFYHFDPSKYRTIGSIVMNCNPFTYGHRYLIEHASKQVDFLIIFVVEEDASLFTFDERFAMVCEGTADLKNIMVVPSGEYILSRNSFPEYFIKETDEDIIENTENDVTLFAEQIAPPLGITHRFVGEEWEDEVTKAYNSAMKKILPAYGIQVVEIPRKQSGSEAISASRVRRYLETNELTVLEDLIPESTKNILFFQNE